MSRRPRTLTMPPRWPRVRGAYSAPGVHASGFAPRLQHRTQPFSDTLDAWHLRVAAIDATRTDYELEDDDRFDLAGHQTVYRRFGHTESGVAVLSEEWLWVVRGVAHSLLGTAAAEDYEVYCDLFESVAETFDPDAGRRPRSA